VGDDAPRYKRGWDGEYRQDEGLFGPAKGELKRGTLTGEPVPALDMFGNQVRAADGTPLYQGASTVAGGGLVGLAILAMLLVAAVPLISEVLYLVILGFVIGRLRRSSSGIRRLVWGAFGLWMLLGLVVNTAHLLGA
jgi:hypothetical protein